MSPHPLPSPLPSFDRCLLSTVAVLVPRADRGEWSRTWRAELWHIHHRNSANRASSSTPAANLFTGLVRDALWLRGESWRRTFSGTATFCLVSLLSLVVLAALLGLALAGSGHALALSFADPFHRFLFEAPLVVFAASASISRRHVAHGNTGKPFFWIRRQLFFIAKTSLLLLLAFLPSADILEPTQKLFPITSLLLQTLLFVLFAIVALRWSFRDQEHRCKQCLRSLTAPTRVGRPSHNLLEWNGTELLCKQGHGTLNVPEMETSWCEFSQWVDHTPIWDEPAGI